MMRSFLVVGALGWQAIACRANGGGAQSDASVYVPLPLPSAETGVEAAAGAAFGLGQIDRAGRPLVAVLLVPGSMQDDFNAASTFDAPLGRTLQEGLTSRLHALDTIALADGGSDPIDWPIEGGAHPLTSMLATDVLLVDTALACNSADGGFSASYLDIEREIFPDIFGSDAGHKTCGGRTPGEDVVSAMLTLIVTRDRDGGRVSQGVAGPTKLATTTFPYLAAPNAL
jgi:hypothetical protein